jgi:hypothetical protein
MRKLVEKAAAVTALVCAATIASMPAASASVEHGACGSFWKDSRDSVCLRGEDTKGPVALLHVIRKDGHVRAWGQGSMTGHVWLEQRHAGATKVLHRKTVKGSRYTLITMGPGASVYDGPGYKVRTCVDDKGGKRLVCTRWH